MSQTAPSTQRRGILSGTALLGLFLLLALPSAVAQTQPSITLTPQPDRIDLGPNETATVQLRVANTGQTDGSVTLDATGPRGWQLTLAERSFTLAAGASRTVPLEVRADSGAVPQNGSITFTGRITNTATFSDQKTAQVGIGYVAPAAPPLPPPPKSPLPWILGSIAAVTVVALGAYLLQAKSVRLDVTEATLTVTKGSTAAYEITITNRAWYAQTVELRVQGLVSPWAAAFMVPYARLEAREKLRLPVSINPPLSAIDESRLEFQIAARANRWSPWLARRDLQVQVARKERIVPETTQPA